MDFYRKRRLSIIVICAYLFLGGVEFAVIFPTAWDYLQSLGVRDEYMLGITISAYSFSGAIAGILGGYLADFYPKRTRAFCVLCVLIMFVGNLQYTVGQNAWNVVGSRLVCGFGTAAGATLLAYVCRVTTAKERTAILSICNASRQIGVLIGPACQVLLIRVNIQIGPVHINSSNSAGLLMAILWIAGFLPLLIFVGYFDYTSQPLGGYETLPSEYDTADTVSGNTMQNMSSLMHHSLLKKDEMCSLETSTWNNKTKKYDRYQQSPTESEIDAPTFTEQLKIHNTTNQLKLRKEYQPEDSSDESLPQAWERPTRESSPAVHRSNRSSVASIANLMASISINPMYSSDNQTINKPSQKMELLSDIVVSLLGTAFTLFFCQVLIETIIPVFMKGTWGFGDVATSMAYLIGGLECLILFAALIPLSRFISDTILQLVGKIILLIGFIILTIVLPTVEKGDESHFWYFVCGCLTVGFAYPIASVSNASLLSKALSNEVQGMGQGLRRLASYLGLIIGPLWAGSTVRQPALLMGASLVLISIHTLMFLHVMKKLTLVERAAMRPTNPEDDDIDTSIDNILLSSRN